MAVYFLRAGKDGPVKIGSAIDVAGRLRELQCGNYEELILLRTIDGGAREERLLHRHFAAHRGRGEWFSIDADTVASLEPPLVAPANVRLPELQRAVDFFGSQSKLAAAINVAQAHVSYWLTKARRLPPEYAIPIEKATGGVVTRHDLRPDIFRPEDVARC